MVSSASESQMQLVEGIAEEVGVAVVGVAVGDSSFIHDANPEASIIPAPSMPT